MKQKRKFILPIISSVSIIATFSTIVLASAKCVPSEKKKKEPKNPEKPTNPIKNPDDGTPIVQMSDQEFENLINSTTNLESLVKINYLNELMGQNKTDILPTLFQEKYANSVNLSANETHKGKIKADIINVNLDSDHTGQYPSNKKGEFDLYVIFTNRSTGKTISKSFRMTGFKTNQGIHHSGSIYSDPTKKLASDFQQYNSWNQKQRFQADNNKYMTLLKRQTEGGATIEKVRPELKGITDEQRNKFDQEAAKVGFDTYENAAIKGFTLPVYNANGKVEGLKLSDRPEIGKGPSWVDALGRDINKTTGLARTLPNETYRDIALQTFQISFINKQDYEKEISDMENNKKIIDGWTDEQFKKYKDGEANEKQKELDKIVERLEEELKHVHDSVKEAKQKEIEKIKTEYKQKIDEIKAWTKDQLKAIQDKYIEEYKVRIATGKEFVSESGTMWIMDYIKNNDGTMKFYFGTNSHVARALKKDKTKSFSILRLNQNAGIKTTFKLSELDPNFTRFSFNNTEGITKIFDATDFMTDKPSDYLAGDQKEKFKENEDFLDFAVIEIDFSKYNNTNISATSAGKDVSSQFVNGKSQQELIKTITNDYENSNKKVKFRNKSYLNDFEKINRPLTTSTEEDKKKFNELDQLYILGYPISTDDFFLQRNIDDDQLKVVKQNFSLWINSEYKYYNQLTPKEGQPSTYAEDELKRGNFLSYQIGYRSFIDKPGITDGFLASHRVGKELYYTEGKRYLTYGLEYMARFYTPAGGASGSSVRNQNNEIVGVIHAANLTAKTSLIAALRSEGYDYKGLFGQYNLPQYDLIYGGGKNQKNSFRQVLLQKYASEKSQLFPNGFGDDKIPEEFKFKNQ